MVLHMDGYEIDPVELPPDSYHWQDDFQMSMLETPQVLQTELPQDQPFQDNVTPPPQPQSHTAQQPFPAGEGSSGFLGLSEYGTSWNQQPDNVPLPPQLQSHPGQQPFTAGEDTIGLFGPSEHYMSWNQQPDNTPPPLHQSHMEQQPLPAGEVPGGFLGPSDYMLWNQQPDNVPSPPQHPSYAGQQQFPVGEDSTGILDPSEVNTAQIETPLVQGDDSSEQGPLEFVVLPPVQGPDPPAATPQHRCSVCGRPFKRLQEKNRHVRSALPHCIYCPFLGCPYRCDRSENLVSHWTNKHGNSGQAPLGQQQAREFQIYDPNPLVKRVVSGDIPMEVAIDNALSWVEVRAQELGKEGAWAGNLWGRRQRPHVWPQ